MAFDSFNAFLVMDGHGPYVWTCYGVFFLLMGLLAWLSVFERHQVVRAQRLQHNLQSTSKGSNGSWGQGSDAGFQRIQPSPNESAGKS